ncbi:MAG: biosynthetic arginine decarboxylase [Deltaproteobacteria bacterium]|nr:biosynthetic arginine decarboxylase [Deltaproteobacteria bacterium]
MKAWTSRDSAELYNTVAWSKGYFDVNAQGNVMLTSNATGGGEIDIKRVVDDLVRRGLSMPLLLRFSDILERQVELINHTFQEKIEEYGYKGRYHLVMPIKVNQQRHVVEELTEFGRPHGLGLEAGSKPELLIALALLDQPDGLIVCNGYKDEAYIETALLAQRLGRKPLIIMDRLDELDLIIKTSQRLGLPPNIGVRSKLSTKGSGRWAESGGDRSKFGLTAGELVHVVETLERESMLDRLMCLHFHIGSQVTAIRAIKEALGEAVRIFADLYKMGAPLQYLDVGGGLAVDYDGSRTNFHASKNYSLEEYAADIVYHVGSALDEQGVPHPTIISESGRALVAHQAVLVFNVLGQTTQRVDPSGPKASTSDDHQIIEDMREILATVNRKNYQEAYHDALQLKEDALSLYRHGILDLRGRALVEELFWSTANKIWRIAKELDYVPEDLDGLEKQLCDTYYCNFSVFQSVPDSWAVKHLFPVMPIHRLNEQPTRRGIIADLTCDSDGKMDQFIDLHDVKPTLELHPLKEGEPYFLGVFLVGAYQEILGDLHNLFGDVNAVHIRLDKKSGGYSVKNVVEGDRVKDVLSYVSYDQRSLMEQLRASIERALTRGTMTFEESAALVRNFEAGMSGYTYLEVPGLAETLLSSVLPSPALKLLQRSDQASEG